MSFIAELNDEDVPTAIVIVILVVDNTSTTIVSSTYPDPQSQNES